MKFKVFGQQSLNLGVFLIITYASYLLILLSLPYIHFEPNVEFLKTKQLIYHIKVWRYSFYIHVFTSPIVIIAGLLQFNRWILKHRPKFHRICGYTYVIVLLFITGPAAFVMSLHANGGYISQVSFTTLSVLWILFTYLSYRSIRKGNVRAHTIWNMRSFALTLSAVTFRFYLYLFSVFKVDIGPVETYLIVSYLSWIPNLIIVELLIWWKYPNYLMTYKDR